MSGIPRRSRRLDPEAGREGAKVHREFPLDAFHRRDEQGERLENKEPGQTFAQYLGSRPVTTRGTRNVLYIQPVGEFTATQMKIVGATADYMRRFFGVDVRTRATIPVSAIPASARRTHPTWGDKQILSTYVLDKLLKPRLPKDAAAVLALTAADLWPGKGWNFVFGQASLRDRVGVWSLYRNGDPDKDKASYQLCLKRTIKTAVHETGHMFSILHCTAWECCMNGSNTREESDRHPLWFCPECNAKVCWATRVDPVPRYRKTVEVCKKLGFEEERAFYEKSLARLAE